MVDSTISANENIKRSELVRKQEKAKLHDMWFRKY